MDNPTSIYPNPPVRAKKKPTALIVVVIIVIAVVASGIVLFRRQNKNSQSQSNVSLTPTQEPSATPTPKIDKQTVKIEVLNGTGTPGQAASAVKALENAGYNAGNIKTDNAASYDQSVTTIATKAEFAGITDDIKTALGSTFDTITVDSSQLGNDSAYDVVITTGGKIYETPTPAETPTITPTGNPTNTPTPTANPTNTPTPTSTPSPSSTSP